MTIVAAAPRRPDRATGPRPQPIMSRENVVADRLDLDHLDHLDRRQGSPSRTPQGGIEGQGRDREHLSKGD